MSSEWPIKSLSQIADVLTGFPFKGDEYLPPRKGIRVVRGDNVTERYVRWGEKEKCWAEVTVSLQPYVLRAGDVVVGMDGSKVGKNFAAISAEDDGALLAQRVARIRAREGVSQDFLRYLICNQSFTDYVKAVHTGTSIPHISKKQIENFEVSVPPLCEQVSIASVLTSLDDRIALLRETNATLEAIAQALFKSWFVDFDPVRAKQQGLMPEGMDEATAALFPDGFEESELGLVPRGWPKALVGNVCQQIFSGGTPDTRKPEYWNGDIPWFSSGETRNRVVIDTEKKITQAAVDYSSTKLASPGDILIASAGQGHTRGQTSYCSIETYINQSVVSVRADRARCHPLWLFYNLSRRYEEMRNLSDSHSSRGSLTTKLLARMPILIPSFPVIGAFADVVSVLVESQVSNDKQAKTLAALRDTLLPRLISGQLRLPEAQELVEEFA